VRLRSLFDAWNSFFFAPQSPLPIALFRILYGLLVIATLLLLRPDWLTWYGPHAWVSLSTMHTLEPGTRLNLFAIIPQKDTWIDALFWVFLASASLLTVGLLTRFNSLIVFLCLTSIQQRNLYITSGGDTFLRLAGFFLIFAPAGAALSVDRLLRILRGKEGASVPPRSPWAQRMIQFELALLYFSSFCWKVQGAPWVQGTALYYVYHLDEFHRFPLPSWFLRPTMLKLGSWTALALEFSLGVLIWIRELRYFILALGVMFHLWLEYSINVPLFEWDVLAAYVLFIEPDDMARVWNWIRGRIAAHFGEPVTVIYDGASERLRRLANLLRAIDVFHRLSLVDLRDSQTRYNLPPETNRERLLVATPSGFRQGPDGLQTLAAVVPLLWPLALPAALQRLWTLTFRRAAAK
jgi:Vitamin K-dependent gamma-carboxylase